MINWIDPKRWIVVQYRPGTGGKFLCSAIMTLNSVCHWDKDVESGLLSHESWLEKFWRPADLATWIDHEPTIHYHTDFYSRSRERGNEINLPDYQTIMQSSAPEWYCDLWQSKKLLLDWLNKPQIPPWLQGSTLLKLDVRNRHDQRYFDVLKKKLFPYDKKTGFGTVMMDNPNLDNLNQNALKFSNNYVFGPFESELKWYNWIWENYAQLNWQMPTADIYFEDLWNFETVHKFIETLSQKLCCEYNYQSLKFTHEYWVSCHQKMLLK